MTRSMSATSAILSVMAVDGVSGEIATPALILRSWMESISAIGSSADIFYISRGSAGLQTRTGRLKMEAVQCSACVRDVVNPLIERHPRNDHCTASGRTFSGCATIM